VIEEVEAPEAIADATSGIASATEVGVGLLEDDLSSCLMDAAVIPNVAEILLEDDVKPYKTTKSEKGR